MDDLRRVVVEVRDGVAKSRRWRVEINQSVPLDDLLPALHKRLDLPGDVDSYEIENKGSIAEPYLLLRRGQAEVLGAVEEIHD